MFELEYKNKKNTVAARMLKLHIVLRSLLWDEIHYVNISYGFAMTYQYGDYTYTLAEKVAEKITSLIALGIDPLRKTCSQLMVMSGSDPCAHRDVYKTSLDILRTDFMLLNTLRNELLNYGYSPTMWTAKPIQGCDRGGEQGDPTLVIELARRRKRLRVG